MQCMIQSQARRKFATSSECSPVVASAISQPRPLLTMLLVVAHAREVLYTESGSGATPTVSGIRVGTAGREKVVTADVYVAALDVPGAQRLLPSSWRRYPEFDNIYKLVGVPVITVQLRWVVLLLYFCTSLSVSGHGGLTGLHAVGVPLCSVCTMTHHIMHDTPDIRVFNHNKAIHQGLHHY